MEMDDHPKPPIAEGSTADAEVVMPEELSAAANAEVVTQGELSAAANADANGGTQQEEFSCAICLDDYPEAEAAHLPCCVIPESSTTRFCKRCKPRLH